MLQLYISDVQLFSSPHGRSSLSPRVSLPLLLSLDTVFCFLFSYFRHYSSLLMDSDFIERLQWIKLAIEEGEVIQVRPSQREKILEECLLSLFGRFLTSRPINLRAAKNLLRNSWKFGPNLKILEVGEGLLQFKFNMESQLQWVLNNGLWSFDNSFLLLRRWEKE